MRYLCESCGTEFDSTDEDLLRKCPECNSESEDHIPDEFNSFHNINEMMN